jgi:hypothetical protein
MRAQNEYCWRELRLRGFAVPRSFLWRCAAMCAVVTGVGMRAGAQPLPDEQPKFSQLPLYDLTIGTTTYWGHDEGITIANSTNAPNTYTGPFVADDFGDAVSQPVTNVEWWGLSGIVKVPNPNPQVLITFFSNATGELPGNAGTFSEPGTVLLSEIVNYGLISPQSGTYTKSLLSDAGPEPLYDYDAELEAPFPEQADTTYWLSIVGLSNVAQDMPTGLGWHDRDWTQEDPYAVPAETAISGPDGIPFYHYQDDAVSGSMTLTITNPSDPVGGTSVQDTVTGPLDYQMGGDVDGPPSGTSYSEDLAFNLYYTVPEPANLIVIPLGAMLLRRRVERM